jgi:hypothetical protein
MAEQSIWMQKVTADPGHSHWYIERFRSMASAGQDLAGEARLVDAVAPRGAAPASSMPAAVQVDWAGIWPQSVTMWLVSTSTRYSSTQLSTTILDRAGLLATSPSSTPSSARTARMVVSGVGEHGFGERRAPVFRHEHQVGVRQRHVVPGGAVCRT